MQTGNYEKREKMPQKLQGKIYNVNITNNVAKSYVLQSSVYPWSEHKHESQTSEINGIKIRW